MHILYITSQYPILTETFIAREMNELVKNGHQVEIGILRHQNESNLPKGLEVNGAKTYRMQFGPIIIFKTFIFAISKNPVALWNCLKDILTASLEKPSYTAHLFYILLCSIWFSRQIQSNKIDFIRAHFLHSEAIAAYWLSQFIQKPYSITAHVTNIYHSRHLIEHVVEKADFCAAITQQMVNLLSDLGCIKIILVRNGVDIEQLKFKDSIQKYSPPVVLAIGSLLPLKGFDILIRACNLLKKRGIPFKCIILGEGNQRTFLEQLISSLSLNNHVFLLGACCFEKVKEYICTSSLLAMPSIPTRTGSDGLPTVIIEAMAIGLPVIASSYAGIPDLVIPGKTGLLFYPGDITALADQVEKLLENQLLVNDLRASARQMIEDQFDIRKNIQLLISAMESSKNKG